MWQAHDKICVQCLVQKPENMRPFGRPMCRWEDNVPTDLTEIGWEYMVGFIHHRRGTSGRLL